MLYEEVRSKLNSEKVSPVSSHVSTTSVRFYPEIDINSMQSASPPSNGHVLQ